MLRVGARLVVNIGAGVSFVAFALRIKLAHSVVRAGRGAGAWPIKALVMDVCALGVCAPIA